MTEGGSWFTPSRLALVVFGVLTVVFLIGPMLVVIPMSFTGAQILSWPPEGFSLQWYEKMVGDPQWSRGFTNSLQVAVLTAVLATILGTMAALGLVRGRFPGQERSKRAHPQPAHRARSSSSRSASSRSSPPYA